MFKSKVLLVLALGGGLIVSPALAQQPSSERARQKVEITHKEFWKQAITNLGNNTDVILKQLESAKKDHPELAATFEALVGYIGFIAKQNRITADKLNKYDLSSRIRIPPEIPTAVVDVCRWIPESVLCRCADDLKRCFVPSDVIPIPKWFPPLTFPRCDDLRDGLRQAIQCKVDAVNAGDAEKIAECQEDIDRYSEGLVAWGCIDRCAGIDTEVDEKQRRLDEIFDNGGPSTSAELDEVLQLIDEIAVLLAEARALGCE